MLRIALCCALWLIVSFVPAQQQKAFEQTADEMTIFELTNKERKAKDLPALVLSPALSKIARAHSENMARQGKFEHKLDGKEAKERVKEAGYKFSKVGENIAMGEDGAKLPKIMKAWMESGGHRENILSAEFVEIGVGIARNKAGDLYITQVFAKPRK
jgi:uncharacterized protein YkwD